MSGSLKQEAQDLDIKAGSKHANIRRLIADGFFDRPVPSQDIVLRVGELFGERWKTIHVQTYMKKFLQAGIIQGVKSPVSRNNFWVLASMPRGEALRNIGKNQQIVRIEEALFSPDLLAKLKKNFGNELDELHDNFGKNGNCCAFLLRKILEKLIIITFSKNNRQRLLEDKARPGGWKGLKEMIEIAAREKVDGISFLGHKTASETGGIKFLGDTAAHNPLVGVDMTTIVPQMPYILTAYKELAERL